ncbi:response regulator receiver protein (plasmid) [Caballeronia insecticola]|uniref:Response regulator receiver protein n=1 Tax=Caballeronia insecticola TaxID=758793 RepID=R4WUE7_9BURK|nr:response regulator receiver protein [Caballeronia insecticola]
MVDDDESVRESLPDLLWEMGFEPCAFASAEEFLESGSVEKTKCLILDIKMPGMSGPELASTLRARGIFIPVIFITANDRNIYRMDVVAEHAVACLYKPFSDEDLYNALLEAGKRGEGN